jgi:hypothetical protein
MFPVESNSLLIEIDPRRLSSCSYALWLDKPECSSRILAIAMDGLDVLGNYIQQELILEWFMAFNFVQIESCLSFGLILLLFFLLFLFVNLSLLGGIIE